MKGPEAPSTRFVETPSSSKYTITQESIEQLHKRDDVDLHKGWRRVVFRFAPWLGFLNTALYIFYLGLRIACVILAQNAQGIVYAGAWAFLAVEIMVAIPSQLHNFWTCFAGKKRHRPKLRLRGDEVPTVDAFITCCGEDDEVVLDTVRAALHQDYPRDRFRVLVLDDGKSAGLEAYINQLAAVHDNVFYVARAKFPGVPHHFKAGNLNNGLEVVDKMGAGEFMAALDADMVRTAALFLFLLLRGRGSRMMFADSRAGLAARTPSSHAHRPENGPRLPPSAVLQHSQVRPLGTKFELLRARD